MNQPLFKVEYSHQAKELFKPAAWKRARQVAAIRAGEQWIAESLPKRFTMFAVQLGYTGKKLKPDGGYSREERIKFALSQMWIDGTSDRIIREATAQWGGWNPLQRGEGPPAAIWKQWVTAAIKAGTVKPSVSGAWQTARRKFRDEVVAKSRILERLRNHAIDHYIDGDKSADPLPLVRTGTLRNAALGRSRVKTRGTDSTTEAKILIPREGRQNKQATKVLQNIAPGEPERFAATFEQGMQAFLAGTTANKRGSRRSVAASVTKSQRDLIARNNNSRRKSRAPAHVNRQPAAHRNRSTA